MWRDAGEWPPPIPHAKGPAQIGQINGHDNHTRIAKLNPVAEPVVKDDVQMAARVKGWMCG